MFAKSFTIAEDVEIKGAELKDGLLNVSMEKVIPEHKKARTIEIKQWNTHKNIQYKKERAKT